MSRYPPDDPQPNDPPPNDPPSSEPDAATRPAVPPPPGDEPHLGPLVDLIRALRGPGGCAWDREQTLDSVRAYLVEEAHEAAAALDVAVDTGESDALADELGDLLFQVAFVGVLQEEAGAPGLASSIRRVHRKMVDRHPHVFGPDSGAADELADADAVAEAWERRKLDEDEGEGEPRSLLDGVPASLPALVASYRLTQKAAAVGFDWPDVRGVVAKIREELGEVEEHLASDAPPREGLRDEVGDLLFSVANLARWLDLDPEAALAGTNRKFRRRFRSVEEGLHRRGRSLADADLEEMDALWERAKEEDR